MEGAFRLQKAYSDNYCKRKCILCCCSKRYKHKYFFSRWLRVTPAIDPSLILWENLGFTRRQRNMRIVFTSIVTIILIACAATAIIFAKEIDKDLQEISPQVACDANIDITQSMAYYDYQASNEEKQGFFYCYC
mmetsp:Transcript_18073/g.13020  ORF Transcript_18073/g.13020 Transcript_18073/m.13020 type:complete len:134 (+) Transcript_18073:1773-2174(+)